PVRVENHRERPLLMHGGVEGGLPIADGYWVVRLLVVLCLPIAGRDARKLPAQPAKRVGVRIILDRVDEGAVVRDVLAKFILTIRIDNEFARQLRIIRRHHVEYGTIDSQEVAVVSGLVEDLAKQPG